MDKKKTNNCTIYNTRNSTRKLIYYNMKRITMKNVFIYIFTRNNVSEYVWDSREGPEGPDGPPLVGRCWRSVQNGLKITFFKLR